MNPVSYDIGEAQVGAKRYLEMGAMGTGGRRRGRDRPLWQTAGGRCVQKEAQDNEGPSARLPLSRRFRLLTPRQRTC